MQSIHLKTMSRYTIWVFLLFQFIACTNRVPAPTTSPLPPAPTVNLQGLSPDTFSTLSSLEQLDDYPFYVMHYVGDYDYPHTGFISPVDPDISCSLFAAMGDADGMLYGRNFDWDFSPSLLLFTDPSDGYASVSMVALSFLDISPSDSTRLADLPLANRTGLLAAPSLPFDGMNEYGLTVAMAAIPDEYVDDTNIDPSKPSIGSIGIIRQMLDHARNVDEALAIFEQYNIDFSGGPPIHYLLADPSGKAVLVEYYQGELVRLPNETPWHLATNHLRCIAKGDGGCWRYSTISERLTAAHGVLDTQAAMQLLSDVKQDSTQWSAVYNMSSGEINVVISRHYQQVYTFHLVLSPP